jgi:hypothetical protein
MPGYPGSGLAKLLSMSQQAYFFANELVSLGELSTAFELQRVTSTYYPWGFAVEVAFSGPPGTFEIDVMGAETDAAANYDKLGSITAVNAGNVGRFEGLTYYPRYVALLVVALGNAATISVTAKVTR